MKNSDLKIKWHRKEVKPTKGEDVGISRSSSNEDVDSSVVDWPQPHDGMRSIPSDATYSTNPTDRSHDDGHENDNNGYNNTNDNKNYNNNYNMILIKITGNDKKTATKRIC
jgi:hypothetical protein